MDNRTYILSCFCLIPSNLSIYLQVHNEHAKKEEQLQREIASLNAQLEEGVTKYRQEAEKTKSQMEELQANYNQLMGVGIDQLSMTQLQTLYQRINDSRSKVKAAMEEVTTLYTSMPIYLLRLSHLSI